MALNFCRKTSKFGRSDWKIFEKGTEQKRNRVCIKGVTYEGMIRVTDEELFKELLVSGIGRGKLWNGAFYDCSHIDRSDHG